MASKIKALRLETCQPLARHLFGGFVWRSGHSYKAYGASFCAPAGFTLTSAIFLLAGCVFYFAFATSSADAATYYLDAVNGNDINAGTSQAPWKTISRAEPNWNGAGTKVTSGDTVKLRNGNYGMFRLTYYTGTDWINYQADTGHSPVLSNIIIDNTGTLRTAYLRFDGIDVIQSDPGYNPNDPPWDYGNRLYLRKVKYFEIKNALISGFNKYLNEIGIYVASSCQITIERCEITKGKFGIFVPGDSNNVSILWNYIHESLASSVSLYGGYHTIVGNHISDSYDDPDDDFFPPDVLSLDTMVFPEGNNPGFQVGEEIWSPATGEPLRKGTVLTYKWIDGQWKVYLKNVWPSSEVFNDGHTCRSQITEVNFVAVNVTGGLHRGSGLSIRSRNSIIRKNILHNLSGQGLYFYQGIGGHYGDVVENNCIYDTVNLNNFFQFSGALVCRNNTFIGYQANTTMNAKNICDKYNGAISTSYSGLPWYGSFDGTGVVYYNNIFMAAGPFPDPNDPNVNGYEEDYNIVWRRYYAGNYEPTSAKGANSKVLVWKDPNTTSNYGLRGYPNSFEDIGYRGSTPEYSYSKDGITPFFVNPSFKFFRSNESLNAGVGSIWDYRLAAGSLGVNFGAYRVATYAEVLSGAVTGPSQPPDSLGSLGPDGFIRDDGPRRDSTHHSVGCYEYGPADVNNQPPVLNEIGNKSVNENSLLTVGVTASDADGDAITYSVSGLPSGATFAGQTFNWTPTYSQAGNYTVTFVVSDGKAQDSETITITANNVNRAPVLGAVGNKSVNENSLLTIGVTASDADGDAITYSVSGLPSGATFAGQTFNWTPTYSQAGNYTVTFVVSDGKAQDSETITITANNVNRAPVLGAVGNKSVNENSLLTVGVTASDADGDAITYSVSGLPSGATFASQTFNWTPTYSQAGNYTVTFVVSDGKAQDSETITITANNVNRAPVLSSIGNKSVHVDDLLTFSVSATDPDGDAVTYSVEGLPSGAVFANQSFSWTPSYQQADTYQVTFIASDGQAQDSKTVTITVNNVNQPPVLAAIGSKSVSENSALSFSVSATDADGDTITYSAQNLPTGANFSGQTFSWTPGYEQAGTYQVTFIASDGSGQDSETITITANNVNRAPVLGAIGNKSVNENSLLTVGITASDADGDTITYSVNGLPSGATFAGQTFNWTPTYSQAGNYTVTFVVSDGQMQDSETITITANNVNRAPVLGAIGNKSVYMGNNLTFAVSATDPDGDVIEFSADGLPGSATFVSQTFAWSPVNSQVGNHQVTFAASDGPLEDSETITIAVLSTDTSPPVVTNCLPAADAVQLPLNGLITLHIADAGKGVDANSVVIKVSNNVVYSGDTAVYSSAYGDCYRSGTKADYMFVYQTNEMFDFEQTIAVAVSAADLAGNVMSQHPYSFTTEMRSFGQNRKVNSGSDTLMKAAPATVRDISGNIWAVWHKGSAGSRDIYIGKLAAGADNFGSSIQLTKSGADQCNPAVAIGSDDKIYVVWQDNRRGNWDIYISTSVDGVSWSAERIVTDSNNNQVNPAIAIDKLSTNRAHIVWQDDRNGNQDIYIATSSNSFLTATISPITSNSSGQIEPVIAVDSSNTVYVVWSDARGGSRDIYGAASNYGPWTNVPIVNNANNQSSPAIAVESEGTILHILWVDDRSGNQDIYYATSDGLPSSPLSGSNIIDDTSGAAQSSPAIVASGSTRDGLKVFACWQDRRNVSSNGGDTDIYLAELTYGTGTNVLVGDDGTNADQSEPAMGIDKYGHPYLVWTDGRNAKMEIYYAGSTFVEAVALETQNVSGTSRTVVGTEPANISSADDVSVVVPAGAYPCDVKIVISKIRNPHAFTMQCLGGYDFGPSGIPFSQPVTVTIPYTPSSSGNSASAYWYNSLTGAISQQGISNVQNIVISPTLHALQFETAHFTPFYLLFAGGKTTTGGGGGGRSGGGCSMSAGSEGDIVEFLLPYVGLAVVMLVLKLGDRRNQKVRGIA